MSSSEFLKVNIVACWSLLYGSSFIFSPRLQVLKNIKLKKEELKYEQTRVSQITPLYQSVPDVKVHGTSAIFINTRIC